MIPATGTVTKSIAACWLTLKIIKRNRYVSLINTKTYVFFSTSSCNLNTTETTAAIWSLLLWSLRCCNALIIRSYTTILTLSWFQRDKQTIGEAAVTILRNYERHCAETECSQIFLISIACQKCRFRPQQNKRVLLTSCGFLNASEILSRFSLKKIVPCGIFRKYKAVQ